jgi:hypothetical protein
MDLSAACSLSSGGMSGGPTDQRMLRMLDDS